MTPRDDDDIDRWLDGLAGRRPSDADDTTDEAAVLRAAIHRRLADEQAHGQDRPDAADTDHAWQRMAFRLRREGLQGGSSGTGTARTSDRRRWLPLAAAAMVAAVVGVQWLLPALRDPSLVIVDDDAPVMRGGPEPVVIAVDDPLASARALGRVLVDVGVVPTLYRRPDGVTVVVEVPADRLDAVQRAAVAQVPTLRLVEGVNQVVFGGRSAR